MMTKAWNARRFAAILVASALSAGLAYGPALALSTKECSTKYKAAKEGGTLGGKSWNDFRKAECGADDKPAATAPAEKKAAATVPALKPATPKVAAGGAVFPNAIAAKFSKETPAKQRFHTCLEQYNANKAGTGNGGMKWIQKGGGYYSQCNARLKQ